MNTQSAVVIIAPALFGLACSNAAPTTDTEREVQPNAQQIELAEARAQSLRELNAGIDRWQAQGPATYVYIGQRNCFCSEGINPVRIVVDAGKVVRAQDTVDLSDQQQNATTIDERLEQALVVAMREDLEVHGTYEATLGYPLEFSRNDGQFADTGSSFFISCFSESTSDSACPMPAFSAADCAEQGGTPTQPENLVDGLCEDTTEPLIELTPSGPVCCP